MQRLIARTFVFFFCSDKDTVLFVRFLRGEQAESTYISTIFVSGKYHEQKQSRPSTGNAWEKQGRRTVVAEEKL
jgi:hypothetical protein